jgi:hypothetical protein
MIGYPRATGLGQREHLAEFFGKRSGRTGHAPRMRDPADSRTPRLPDCG